ncbi:MAG: cysteine-rich KTR domain-containing protein [Oscillospiraceae bacterium]|nr:cysteine-rich KTR domain-containing protein [Oscillospiraceae bacterium]
MCHSKTRLNLRKATELKIPLYCSRHRQETNIASVCESRGRKFLLQITKKHVKI